MKRCDLIKRITEVGCVLLRHGGKHDIYHNPKSGATEPIPIHNEINERLAFKIIRNLSKD